MMRASFRARVVSLIVGSSAAAALAVTLVLSISERSALREGYAERGLVQARIVAAASAVPLAFRDEVDSAETLTELAAVGGIRRAWVFDGDGAVFAAWSADGPAGAPPAAGDRPDVDGTRFTGEGLLAATRIATDGEVLGGVLLDIDTALIAGRLADQARAAVVALVVVLSLTVLVALHLQRRLTRPIFDLVDLTKRVRVGGDATARVTPSRIPEIGALGESLNAMLEQLEDRGRALGEANEMLEERVRMRTDELRRAIARMESEIHVRERVESELRTASQRATAASAAKSAFLANMSHEIRTPMTAILGFADLLLDPASDPDTARDAAQTIRRNGQHLISIINDILDISKIEAGRMQVERIEQDTPDLLREVLELMQVRADGKGIGLDLTASGDIPARIETDPVRLRQVLVNLVGNAIKFTETGGITIEVSYDAEARRLAMAVRDTGIGIEPEAAEQLFQAFAQADDSTTRRYGGTGLGLVISRRLAELLGGGIELSSTPGEGSVFTVTIDPGRIASTELIDGERFRAAALGVASATDDGGEAMVAGAVTEASLAQEPLAGRVVLLVEDGPDNRRLIAHHLRRAGATVHLREDGQLGVDAVLGEDPVTPDLILMDMQMPVLDGYAAATRLRESGWTGPIVALTAHAMEGDRERCLAAGCDDYLTKPIDPKSLVEQVRQGVERRRAA